MKPDNQEAKIDEDDDICRCAGDIDDEENTSGEADGDMMAKRLSEGDEYGDVEEKSTGGEKGMATSR